MSNPTAPRPEAAPDSFWTIIDEVEAPPGLAGRWRVTQAIEAVAYPTNAEAMTRRVLGLQAAPCPWCGEPHAALPCALCGHDRNRALARQEIAV